MALASCEHEAGTVDYLGLLCKGPFLGFPGTPVGSKGCSTQNWPQTGTAQGRSRGTLASPHLRDWNYVNFAVRVNVLLPFKVVLIKIYEIYNFIKKLGDYKD